MKTRVIRRAALCAVLVLTMFAWSASDAARVSASHGGLCLCGADGQVFIGGQQVGSDHDDWSATRANNADCAGNFCQSQVLNFGNNLCAIHDAEGFSTQWNWTFYDGHGSYWFGNLSQNYACSDL